MLKWNHSSQCCGTRDQAAERFGRDGRMTHLGDFVTNGVEPLDLFNLVQRFKRPRFLGV